MNSPIDSFSPEDRKRIAEDIYYLNTAELREFCDAHSIPYMILAEAPNGRALRTRDADRKGIVIDRILHFLRTGSIKPPTVFRKKVVASTKSRSAPSATDLVLWGSYKNGDAHTLALMKRLTDGKFEFGAIAQEVLRDCWTRGQAPTYAEFAKLWQQATANHTKPNPEWAFLTDLSRGAAGPDWKNLRNQKAATIVCLLKRIS